MPRAGLTPQAVVDLALAVVDDGGPSGWAALNLSAVAHRAGVAVPSLYKHVDGLPALRVAVAARCVEELTAAMEAALADPTNGRGESTTGDWGEGTTNNRREGLTNNRREGATGDERADDEAEPSGALGTHPRTGAAAPTALTGAAALRALAEATRGYALAHPGRYRAVQGAEATTLGERAAAPARLVAHAVEQLGLPPERRVDQVRAVRAAVHGFVELELDGGFGLPEDVDASFRYLVDTMIGGLR